MLRKYRIQEGRLIAQESGDGELWLYVNPDESEKRFLVDDLKIDEHTLTSALDPDELSRLEFEPEHAAIICKQPVSYSAEDEFMFKVSSTGIFLFRDKLILVQAREQVGLLEGKLFNRVPSLPVALLRLISNSIVHFREHLKVINAITDDLERKVNTSMENKYLIHLFVLEKSLVYYLNAINSNSALIDRLRHNASKLDLSPANIELLDDIAIENAQCFKQAEIYSNILASLMDARASIISNNLNLLMKTLNIVTIAIMVPTLVVSAFSMNVPIPLQHHPMAFWMVLGLAVLSVLTFMLVWNRRQRFEWSQTRSLFRSRQRVNAKTGESSSPKRDEKREANGALPRTS